MITATIVSLMALACGAITAILRSKLHAEMFQNNTRFPKKDFYRYWNISRLVTGLPVSLSLSWLFIVLSGSSTISLLLALPVVGLAYAIADDALFGILVNRFRGLDWFGLSDPSNGPAQSRFDRTLLGITNGNEKVAHGLKLLVGVVVYFALWVCQVFIG